MKIEYILTVFFGGGIGAVLRYLLSFYTTSWLDPSFPLGTLIVNTLGSFIIGFISYLSEVSIIPTSFRMFLMVGVIGGFTTFSTFSLENINLLRDGEIKFFVLNIFLSVSLGLGAVVVGYVFGGLIMGRKV
ncbi:MAG: fluoride efflux transporter CrcB [Spirochaetia bacterium]|nr:fluoride efflux transporter CrcB [Spirochaetota bacterium]MCX8096640.1 fluoride efflux transporter CrcB [Spirochaetota bacterium]MDW8112087.1 fluoride efflux transporter CrcB [Spirochaetia bacterium]